MSYIDVDKFADKICNFQAIDEDAANAMIWLLRTFPTADVIEVRHGHWIEHTAKPDWLEDDVEVFYNCSECGSGHWSFIPPYCPNCGAKMDGKRKEQGAYY